VAVDRFGRVWALGVATIALVEDRLNEEQKK